MECLVLPSRVWFGQSYDQVHKLYEYIESRRSQKKIVRKCNTYDCRCKKNYTFTGPVDATTQYHLTEGPIATVTSWREGRRRAALLHNAHAAMSTTSKAANTGRVWVTVQMGFMWGL